MSVRTHLAALVLSCCTAGAAADGVDFTLDDLSGRPVSLSDFRGKWVVVNFWATWCPPCLTELPELARFHRAHAETDAVVVGVNFETIDRAQLEAFVRSMQLPFPVVQSGDTPLLPFEPLKGLPSTFFVDPNGELVASHTGPVTGADIEDFLARERAAGNR
jgi:thiol-disulfide isomerase/thioredoxin